MATQKALVLEKYGQLPVWKDWPVPVLKPGQLLVKVQATTLNPSDRGRLAGVYAPFPLPGIPGLQGVGTVVEASGADIQGWIGKRVSFLQDDSGSWGQYATTIPFKAFAIGQDVPQGSAASGIVNPLTVVGMTDLFETNPHKKGIIHTAAASALGRMLNKRCIRLGIPLLNIVRKQEHADLLKSEGAQHVIVTSEGWEAHYAQAIKSHGFNVLFDALGGGPITEKLILGLNAHSVAHIYGRLEGKPLTIEVALNLSKGISVTGYSLLGWYATASKEKVEHIREQYSEWLKTDLSTTVFKTLSLEKIEQALHLSVSHATEGKITLIP